MRFSKTIKVSLSVGLFIILILFIIYRNIDIGITEYYSQFWVSNSIDESKKKGVFITDYIVVPEEIVFNQHKIIFDKIWVECISQISYKYTLIKERKILDGYRLVITLRNKISTDSVFIPFVLGKKDSGFTLTGSFNKEIFYDEISPAEMSQDSLFISLVVGLNDLRKKQILLIKT